MIIDLANLGITAKKLDLKLDLTEIDLEGENVTLIGSTRFEGEIHRIDTKTHLRGTLDANVSLDCTRCLEPNERQLKFYFQAIFVDSGLDDTSAETELKDEALDESLVDDGKINIVEAVREQILLALPEQIFCKKDCKGLCPKCGSNLNLIDCNCADDEVDPRWAALGSLKLPRKG